MKRIKDFFRNIQAIATVFYILANKNKLTNFQNELILNLNKDLKLGAITIEQHQEEMKIIKNNIKRK